MASLPAALFFNQFVVPGNNYQGSFLLFITLLPLSAWGVRLADRIGFEYRWRFVIYDADIPFERGSRLIHRLSDDGAISFRRNTAKKPFLLFRGDALFRFHFNIESVIAVILAF